MHFNNYYENCYFNDISSVTEGNGYHCKNLFCQVDKRGFYMARLKEFESPTFRLGGGRSILLSYKRIFGFAGLFYHHLPLRVNNLCRNIKFSIVFCKKSEYNGK